MVVRLQTLEDRPAVRMVNEAAFGRTDEADLVEALGAEGVVLLALVAEVDGRVVGYILFSRMSIVAEGSSLQAVALAPIAVLPEWQRKGVGARLIRQGLEMLRERGEQIVIVLGHPSYYPRFGFSLERAGHLESPFPSEAFMALELFTGALDGVTGRVRYPVAFGVG